MKPKQQELFEVRTRLTDIIERLEAAETRDNVVRVEIPRIAHICKPIVPQYFR